MAKGKFAQAAPLLVLLAACVIGLSAQESPFPGIQHATGQDVSPMFNGWARNFDGTFSLYFGYLNRNSREEIDVPIGPDNFFDLGKATRGNLRISWRATATVHDRCGSSASLCP